MFSVGSSRDCIRGTEPNQVRIERVGVVEREREWSESLAVD
jgi:hypothetical protein